MTLYIIVIIQVLFILMAIIVREHETWYNFFLSLSISYGVIITLFFLIFKFYLNPF